MAQNALTDREMDALFRREEKEAAEFDWFANKLLRPREERYHWR